MCLEDISNIVQNKYVASDDLDETEEPGHFVTNIDKARTLGISVLAQCYLFAHN